MGNISSPADVGGNTKVIIQCNRLISDFASPGVDCGIVNSTLTIVSN